jgi:hypothetical protein
VQYLEEYYPKHVFCHACFRLHKPRTNWFRPRPYHLKWNGEIRSGKYISLDCKAWKEQFAVDSIHSHRIFNYWAPAFWLKFHLVMRAHRLGPKYGLPLSTIQRSTPAKIPQSSSLLRSIWNTDFRAVIVGNNLLVRERIFQVVSRREWDHPELYYYCGWTWLEICHHHDEEYNYSVARVEKVQSMLRSIYREGTASNIWSGLSGRCKWCPTEWQLHLLPKKVCLRQNHEWIPQTDSLHWIGDQYMILLIRYSNFR